MKAGPHWPLQRVKDLVKKGRLFVQRTRALDFFPTLSEALQTARTTLLELKLTNFAHTVKMTYDVADVYGVLVESDSWYLKLTIDEHEPEVVVISFHPLERPLKTRGGILKP
jgi:hypothetical protein